MSSCRFRQAATGFPYHADQDGVYAMHNNRSLIHLTTVPSLPTDILSGWFPCTCTWLFQILRNKALAFFGNSFSSFRSLISFCSLRLSASSSRRWPLPAKGCCGCSVYRDLHVYSELTLMLRSLATLAADAQIYNQFYGNEFNIGIHVLRVDNLRFNTQLADQIYKGG